MLVSEFQEELYSIPGALTLVLDSPWVTLPADAREMINNLCAAVKSRPAPSVIHRTTEELLAASDLPEALVVFGNSLPDIPLHQVTAWKGTQLVVTHPAGALAGNAAAKKELWSALQALVRETGPKPA